MIGHFHLVWKQNRCAATVCGWFPRKLEVFIYLFIYSVRLSPKGTERCGGQSGQLECLPPNPSTQGHTKHIRWDSRNCRWEAGREMGLGGGEAQQVWGAQMSAFPEAHTVALCVRAKGREGWRAVTWASARQSKHHVHTGFWSQPTRPRSDTLSVTVSVYGESLITNSGFWLRRNVMIFFQESQPTLQKIHWLYFATGAGVMHIRHHLMKLCVFAFKSLGLLC